MSKTRKKQPYIEIIDLQSEIKEYMKLCRGKSEKFTYYLDWKKHIIEKLLNLKSLDEIENFKHYLINHNRVNKSIYIQIVPLLIFYFTIMFGNLPKEVNNQALNLLVNLIVNLIVALILVFISLIIILFQNDYYNKEYCFYCDVLEILEEISVKEINKCHLPSTTTKTP